MTVTNLNELAMRYKADPESVYNTWFIDNDTRMKAFRSIRRGVMTIVASIKEGTFGNDFKGSPLELVLSSITEQKQVFEGAAHPFYWKPKLRIPDPGGKSVFRQGLMTDMERESLSLREIKEFVRYAYYSSPSGLHPGHGETTPSYGKSSAYTWLKAPRHRGKAYETGPLARMTVSGYYKGGCSTMDRILARAEETKLLVEYLPLWIDELVPDLSSYTDLQLPPSGSGVGLTEAPRGALGHWMECSSGSIARYQIITPTCWNASPRDDSGVPGPIEHALVGTFVEEMNQPVELLRIIHSFDPCTSCSVH